MAIYGLSHGESYEAGRHQIVPTPTSGKFHRVVSLSIKNPDAIPHNVKVAMEGLMGGQIEVIRDRTLAPGEVWTLSEQAPLAADPANALVLVLDALCGTRPISWAATYVEEGVSGLSGFAGKYLGPYSGSPDTKPGDSSGTSNGLENTLALSGLLAAWVADDMVDSLSDGATITQLPAHVGGLTPQGGSATFHKASANANSQPTISTTTPLVSVGNTDWATLDIVHYLAVLYLPGSHNGQAAFGIGGTSGQSERTGLSFSSAGKARYQHQGNRQDAPSAVTGLHCLSFWHDKSSYPYLHAELDGAPETLGSMYADAGTLQNDTFVIGSMHTDGTFGTFSGEIALLLVFNRIVTGADLTTIEGELATKYGITFT